MIRGIILFLLLVAMVIPTSLKFLLTLVLGNSHNQIYPFESPLVLTLEHLGLVLITSLFSFILGVSGAVFSYWHEKSHIRGLLQSTGAILQTVPPLAFLALAIPLLGFGTVPVFWSLTIFGILPIFHSSLSGFESINKEVSGASVGLGFSKVQKLLWVDLPLAFPSILSGIRTSVMINIGTAAIAATMGSGGLGKPIIAGISEFHYSYLLQGSLTAALLALLADWGLQRRKKRPPKII